MPETRHKLLAGWRKLPLNKPPWETWKRMVFQYHNEARAWEMWMWSQEKKSK